MEEGIDIGSPIVFDASAVLSFLMPDEKATPAIQQLFDKLVVGDIEILAPGLLPYEVVNTLKSSLKRKRITKKLAFGILERFFQLGIELADINFRECLSLSLRHDISVYDASYLELARSRKLKLVSFDERLMELTN